MNELCYGINRKMLNSINPTNLIRIASWNIFAQGFVEADNFRYCAPDQLTLDNRMLQFSRELDNIHCDIYCLQEADIHTELCQLINTKFAGNKYIYQEIFAPKKYSPCLLYPNNKGPDGLSIIYNGNLLDLIDSHYIMMPNDESVFAIICTFQIQTTKFIVVNTHLKSKKKFVEYRTKQIQQTLKDLAEIMKQYAATSVIYCGDFNSCAEESSFEQLISNPTLNFFSLYDKFYPNEFVSPNGTQEANQHLIGNSKYFTSWKFKKPEAETSRQRTPADNQNDKNTHALHYVDSTGGEICEVIDYIFCSSESRLCPVNMLEMPTKSDIGEYGIPCATYPSDHIALRVDFVVK